MYVLYGTTWFLMTLDDPLIGSAGVGGGVGTAFRLKGSVIHLSFVDLNGVLIPAAAEPWRDASRNDDASAAKDSGQFVCRRCRLQINVFDECLKALKHKQIFIFSLLCQSSTTHTEISDKTHTIVHYYTQKRIKTSRKKYKTLRLATTKCPQQMNSTLPL